MITVAFIVFGKCTLTLGSKLELKQIKSVNHERLRSKYG